LLLKFVELLIDNLKEVFAGSSDRSRLDGLLRTRPRCIFVPHFLAESRFQRFIQGAGCAFTYFQRKLRVTKTVDETVHGNDFACVRVQVRVSQSHQSFDVAVEIGKCLSWLTNSTAKFHLKLLALRGAAEPFL